MAERAAASCAWTAVISKSDPILDRASLMVAAGTIEAANSPARIRPPAGFAQGLGVLVFFSDP